MPEEELPKVKERKFVEIDRDNINDIMASINPRLALRVNNTLANDGTQMSCVLNFKNLSDFEPVNVVKQVPALERLYEARTRLKDLLTKLDGNDTLGNLLQEIITNTEKRDALKQELGMNETPAPEAQK
jgi:type VI secretion system protein ImpB